MHMEGPSGMFTEQMDHTFCIAVWFYVALFDLCTLSFGVRF